MYASFFGLKQDPFSIAPDPRYLFMSERHREALAHLLYGLGGGGGFVLLSGEIGTGKTTVCRCFLEQIPADCNVAYVFNPKLTALELLQSVCEEFHIALPATGAGSPTPTAKELIDRLNAFLLQAHAAGRNNVLIIDEAQNLSADVLEQLRLLTNLETNERKLLQIVLIGQPELRRMLARPELEQLAQRVIARFHLDALTQQETEQYIRHRMAVAGLAGPLPFDAKALQRIHALARGVPRRINLLGGRALLGAYAHGQAVVTRPIVEQAAREVFETGEDTAVSARRPASARAANWGMGLALGTATVGAVVLALRLGDAGSARLESTGNAGGPALAAATAPASRASAAAPAEAAVANAAPPWQELVRSENAAWRELGTAWGLALPEGEACAAAQQQQVQCWRTSNSSFAIIRQLGRPGILTLADEARRPGYALLLGLEEEHARLRIGEQDYRVPLASLAGMWRGEFATFWRTPPGYAGRTSASLAGARGNGPLGEWLAERLTTAPGGAASAGQPLAERIAQFQLAQGLTPDGRIGPITLMQLNRAGGVDEPQLAVHSAVRP